MSDLTCPAQDRLGLALTVLIEDPAGATVQRLVAEALQATTAGPSGGGQGASAAAAARGSLWIAPCPVSVKLRLFCLPYAGGVSENVFARCMPPLAADQVPLLLDCVLLKLISPQAW